MVPASYGFQTCVKKRIHDLHITLSERKKKHKRIVVVVLKELVLTGVKLDTVQLELLRQILRRLDLLLVLTGTLAGLRFVVGLE